MAMADHDGGTTEPENLSSSIDFRLLFEHSPDILVVLLPDPPRFTQIAATEARFQATNTTRDQTIGRGLFELFPDNPDDPGATGMVNLRASLARVLSTRSADTMAVQKYDIRRPDGTFEIRHWSPKNIPILGPSGEVLFIFHRVEDVTELVRASELGEELRDRSAEMEREVLRRSRELSVALREVREANAKLGALDAAKTAFFNNVSHEFRTPLTLILGPVEEALQAPTKSLYGEALEAVHRNSLRLLGLVNTVLDFSRIEAGRLHSSFEETDLASLTAGVAGSFQSLVESAGLKLVVDCPRLEVSPFVDRSHWEKIVLNLLSNAFKFTLEGSITVRLRGTSDRVELTVEDTGTGIPEDELAKVFSRFHRVPGARGRTFEGSGIGLALVHELVSVHGGEVRVESRIDAGSTFTVSIPLGSSHLPKEWVAQSGTYAPAAADVRALDITQWAQSSQSEQPSEAPAAREGRVEGRDLILIVDDNSDMQNHIARLLRPFWNLSRASDGAAALEAIQQEAPDLVLSDVMMPRMNGVELLRALRANPRTNTIPIILLSARAGEDAVLEGLETGADDYMVKPFSARELLTRVRTHLEMARVRKSVTEAARQQAETRASLLAEVERKNRELEAFSSSVSHDLRSPLRSILGFTAALSDEYGSALDTQAAHYLDQVRLSAERMAALIEDLLKLARVERADLRRERTDLSAMARRIAKRLGESNGKRAVNWKVSDSLFADVDAALFEIVFENLLGNALKFTHHVESPAIEFGSKRGESTTTFFVRDNGAGFDPAHASRLFVPFRRLHSESEFPGTGVGLATVQRIIDRHGGKVWAEATVGKGATIFWTL